MFKTDDKHISIIKNQQIMTKLPNPKIIITGERIKYQFLDPIDVDG